MIYQHIALYFEIKNHRDNLFAVLMAEKLVAVAGKLANALATWAAVAPLAPAVKVRPSKTTVLPAANALNCVLLVF